VDRRAPGGRVRQAREQLKAREREVRAEDEAGAGRQRLGDTRVGVLLWTPASTGSTRRPTRRRGRFQEPERATLRRHLRDRGERHVISAVSDSEGKVRRRDPEAPVPPRRRAEPASRRAAAWLATGRAPEEGRRSVKGCSRDRCGQPLAVGVGGLRRAAGESTPAQRNGVVEATTAREARFRLTYQARGPDPLPGFNAAQTSTTTTSWRGAARRFRDLMRP
jgi:hypothetical protein